MIKASVVSFGLRIFQTIALFFSGVVWARFLGVESYGAYAYVWSVVTVLSIFTLIGTPNFIAREVAAASDMSEVRKVVLWSFNRASISTLCVLVFVGVLWAFGLLSRVHLSGAMVVLLAVALVLNAFLRFYESIMRGLHKYVVAQIFSSFIGPSLMVLVGGYFYMVGNDFARDESALVTLRVITLVVGCLFIYPLFRLNYRIGVVEQSKEWGKSLFQFVIAGVAISANYELATIIVANFLDFERAGIFNVITRIASVMSMGIVAISSPVGPRVAAEFKSKNMQGVQELLSKTVLYATSFTVPLFLVVVIWGGQLLEIYGIGFANENSIMGLRVLAVGQLLATVIGPSGVLLVMTKHEKLSSISVLFSVFVMILLSFLLIPNFSVVGAALAVSCSLVTWKGVMSYLGWKKLGVITLLGGQLIKKIIGVRYECK